MCAPSCFHWWRELDAAASSRRDFLKGIAVAPLVAAGCATGGGDPAAGRAVLDDVLSVDLHAHPALFRTYSSTTIEEHARAVETGKVGAVFLAAVGDGPVLSLRSDGGPYAAREPDPGALLASVWGQLDVLDGYARVLGMRPALRGADLAAAATARTRAAIMAVEGCDFLEGRLENVQHAYDRGVRSLQLVHYRVNELGDIQTERPLHKGLTPFGRDVVLEMNRLGMLIDLAHATYPVVTGAVEASQRPMIISHTNIQDPTGFSRFVTPDHARLVASHGGVLGAWPMSLRPAGFKTFVEQIKRMIDVVGIDHVAIGTDMSAISPRNALFTSYLEWPSIPTALLDRGFEPGDVGKIMGGNAQRVLAATLTG